MRAREHFSPVIRWASRRRRCNIADLLIAAALVLPGCGDHDSILNQIHQHNNGYGQESDSDGESSSGDPTLPDPAGTGDPGSTGSDSDGMTGDYPSIERFLVNGSTEPSKLTNFGTAVLRVETANFDGEDVRFYIDGDLVESDEGNFSSPSPGVFAVEIPVYDEPLGSYYTFEVALVEDDIRVESQPIDLEVDLPEARTVAWDSTISLTDDIRSTAAAVTFDAMGFVYATGSSVAESTGQSRLWVAKFSHHGHQLWIKTFDQPEPLESRGLDIVVDRDDNVVVAGERFRYFGGDYDPVSSWVAKYRGSDGQRLWETVTAQGAGEQATGLALYYPDIDEPVYQTVVVGNYFGLDDAASQGFVRLLDSDGSTLATETIDMPDADTWVTATVLDNDNYLYTAGYKQVGSVTEGFVERHALPSLTLDETWNSKVFATDMLTGIALTENYVLVSGHRYVVGEDLTFGLLSRSPKTKGNTFTNVYTQDFQAPADEALMGIALDKQYIVGVGDKSHDDGRYTAGLSFFEPDTITDGPHWQPQWSYVPEPDPFYNRVTSGIAINPSSDYVVFSGTSLRRDNPEQQHASLTAIVY